MVNSPARNFLSLTEAQHIGNEKLRKKEEERLEEEDEEEMEIERIIRRSSIRLNGMDGTIAKPRRAFPQSCSTHANLNFSVKRERKRASEAEDDNDEDEEEDSDEELFALHSSLQPLRKSKSAFAGFQSVPRIHKSTTPFGCPVVVKETVEEVEQEHNDQERSDQPDIAELIDLARGDVLEFRVSHGSPRKSPSCTSSATSSILLEPSERAVSRWSAPAGEEWEAEEEGRRDEEDEDGGSDEEEQEEGREDRNNFLSANDERKASSWSAPSRFTGEHRQRQKNRKNPEEEKEEEEEQRVEEVQAQGEELLVGENGSGSEEDEEEDEEESELYMFDGGEPRNMKNLEIEEGRMDDEDERMSMTTDEENEEDEKPLMKEGQGESVEFADPRKQMRVFVTTNHRPQPFAHYRPPRFPSSRSDTQLLWHRSGAPPPPPPAPFPLDPMDEDEGPSTRRTMKMAHSKTYGGFEAQEEAEEEEEMMRKKEEIGRKEEDEGERGEEEKEVMRKEEEDEQREEAEEEKIVKRNEQIGRKEEEEVDEEEREEDEEEEDEEQEDEEEGKIVMRKEEIGRKKEEEDEEELTGQAHGEDEEEEQGQGCFIDEREAEGKAMSRQVQILAPEDDHKTEQSPAKVQFRHNVRQVASMRMSLPNPAPSCPPAQWHFAHRPRTLSIGDEGAIPMADDCPTPNMQLLPGNLVAFPFGTGQKNAKMDNSLTSSSYYSEEEEEGRGRTRKGRIPVQRSAAARLCRRGSPPFAQSELLSESEISDLEQEIASGRLVRSCSGTSAALKEFVEEEQKSDEEEEEDQPDERRSDREEEGADDRMNDEADKKADNIPMKDDAKERGEDESNEEETDEQIGKINEEEEEPFGKEADRGRKIGEWNSDGSSEDDDEEDVRRESTDSNDLALCGSSSMPTLPVNSYWGSGYVPSNFWQSEYPAEDEPWEDEAQAQQMHRSLTVQSEMEGRRVVGGGSRRRRMLPLPPDQWRQATMANEAFEGRAEEKERLSPLVHRRQLPRTPSSSGDDPLDKIDIASATKEYLLSALHNGSRSAQRHQGKEKGMERHKTTEPDPDDFSPTVPILPSPSTVQRPNLPLTLPGLDRWHNPSQNAQSSEYKLSYGMDQSVLRQARKGLSIEESYYEDVDGLNGNLAGGTVYCPRGRGGWADELYTPDEEGDRRRGFHMADGNKSSSGISSCCTTSSRGCEQAEIGFGTKRPNKAHPAPAVDPNDPTAPTHRAQFPFMPRHADEIRLDKGDALHIVEKFEDHWCHGTNLRTGKQGIFPEAHVVEIDLVDEICQSMLPDQLSHQLRYEQDTFYLTLMASVEVAHHKGNDVLVQAINKVCSVYQQKEEILVPQTILMEVSFRGIHLIDKRKKDIFRCPTFDYFYSLQNISFCGAHPKELRYFGFITKHPLLPRFACHVFLSTESTQPIVEAIGRAFKRSYDEYMAFAHPTEDIFID